VIALTVGELARVVGGRLHGNADPAARVTAGLAIDSRWVEPGGVFAALPGERVDGHDFAPAAVAAGAVVALTARKVDAPAVVVDDVPAAMAKLAGHVLRSLPGLTVVGVTGSSGKTTTKDMAAGVLARFGPTVAPPGSYNNELGLPITVTRAGSQTRYLVLEYSARERGHIAHLCRVAPPSLAAVLNVGHAHVGVFGSQQAIAEAKSELVAALPADGTAVLNADDPNVAGMRHRTAASVLLFGISNPADVAAREVRLDRLGRPAFRLHLPGAAPQRVQLRHVGAHQVANALAVAGLAHALGIGAPDVAEALSASEPASRWRMELKELPDGVLLLNDAYNANPESTSAALRTLAHLAAGGLRPWAVLGEMAELGAAGPAAHAEIGRLAAELDIARIVAVGESARPVAEEAASHGGNAAFVPDIAAAAALLGGEVRRGDVVLIKASRAVGLEQLAAMLEGERCATS
jgi:UDP-N-acetylmuramoyl-tripeptide--D-alanyl-D-alanine ligase